MDKPEKNKQTTEKLVPIGQIHLSANKWSNGVYSRHGGIGVDVCALWRNRGYGTEAIRWITEWGFMFAGLHRVAIGCYSL